MMATREKATRTIDEVLEAVSRRGPIDGWAVKRIPSPPERIRHRLIRGGMTIDSCSDSDGIGVSPSPG
jgi:hypothetical protein